MNYRFTIVVALTFLLSACNFTLAEDVTPPPNYVPPTPAPTLGPLYPAQAPSVANGASIFAEKCAPCHGATGMGDGAQGIQLGVTVPAFGLPEIAQPASLSQWYTTVTQGNMQRFMPPFASLSNQERWDVVAYAMTLHTTPEQIEKGKNLFEANCANCSTDFFKDQSKTSSLSEVELARIIRQGNDQVKAFGPNLADDEVWDIAAYLRSLSFDTAPVAAASASTATPEAASVTEATQPTAEGTPMSSEQAAAGNESSASLQPGFANITGTIDNQTGEDLPANMAVTLRGYDHGADQTTAPQEVLTLESAVHADGSFKFENVEAPTNRIYTAEITFEGITLQSDFAVAKEGDTAITVPPIELYHLSEDTSALTIDEARVFFEYGSDNTVQVYNVYLFHNPTDQIIAIKVNGNGEVPFIKAPQGSSGFGYEPMQDTEKFISTDSGFAVPPSDSAYGLIAFASIPKANEINFSQQFVLPVTTITVFLPQGVKAENAQLTDLGVQAIQGFNFQIYEIAHINAGDTVAFTASGTPQETPSTATTTNSNQNLLFGAGALGIALILAGAWMYLRDRGRAEEDDNPDGDEKFDSADDVMDAIIALDDLHRARKISDDAYQKRRMQLKEILKGLMK